MACDRRFAAEGEYRVGLPEVSLGLFPGSGGTQRLPRLVGLSRGIDLIATASTLTAPRAHQLGAVDRVLPDGAACRAAATEYVEKIASGRAEAVGHAKVVASLGYAAPLDLGLAMEREVSTDIFATDDAAKGIRAFLETRKANVSGR